MTASQTRIQKILALLDSDQAGEAQAAACALRRLLGAGLSVAAPQAARSIEHRELEASLAYAAEAIADLTREIESLRRDNAVLRRRAVTLRPPRLRVAA